MRTFLSRKPEILLTLLKSLVLPIIDYSNIVWNPHTQQDIASIEAVQRNYTSKLEGMSDLTYYQRLKSLKLYSSERRRDRYNILYIFKIIHGKVPNPGISFKWSPRRGKVLTYPSVKSQPSKAATSLYHSFTRRAGPRGCSMLFHKVCGTFQQTHRQTSSNTKWTDFYNKSQMNQGSPVTSPATARFPTGWKTRYLQRSASTRNTAELPFRNRNK